jgi:A/G-specific adenine glycosylase
MAEHGGEMPTDLERLNALPGIGRSTAGAILAQALDQRHAISDGNVKRVLARWAGIDGSPTCPETKLASGRSARR